MNLRVNLPRSFRAEAARLHLELFGIDIYPPTHLHPLPSSTSPLTTATMAAASDKARFYLEQHVPELQEYAQKQIFTRPEITAIAKKRSDFEHILNARGSKPGDYIRYATYEMNLDSLRKKRCKRMGVKGSMHSGQRTIFFILERATKKFPGDLGLWMQYIDFCAKEKANKKLAKVFTQVLRLRPREWGLWVLAAKHYAEVQGDMTTARSYLQRGLRFCREERRLYLEYAKLEMVYLAKLAARRKILGLDEERVVKEVSEGFGGEEDVIALPDVTAEDIDPDANKGVEEVNADALKRLADAPAYTGAIPIAIFDAAMKQSKDNSDVASDFFDLVASFDSVPAMRDILQHIYRHIQSTAPGSADQIICEAKMHTLGTSATSAEFPAALGQSLAVVKSRIGELPPKEKAKMAEKAVFFLLPFLHEEELDEGVRKVLEASVKRYVKTAVSEDAAKVTSPATLAARLRLKGREKDVEALHWVMGMEYEKV